MKYLKMLSLAAVAAASMMVLVGTASANTVLCETTITTGCKNSLWDWDVTPPTTTPVMDFSLKAGGTARLTDTSGFIAIATCTGGTVTARVETTTTPKARVEKGNLTWTGCSQTTHTITGGTLELHHIPGTHNGTVTAGEFAVTVPFGSNTCSYGFNKHTDIGVLVTSADGLDAELSINTHVELITAHSSASGCPSSGKWIATYTQTGDLGTTKLYIAES